MGRFLGRMPGRGLGQQVPPLLRRANQMMSAGDYAGAASALEQLGRAAEARGGPRAPFFHIQAGRAQVMAGQAGLAVESLERGLGLFATRGQFGKVNNFALRILAELSQRGLANEAKLIADYVKTLMPDFQAGAAAPGQAKRPLLPTNCPGCGAPVHPDEVDWVDEVTAECAFCGTPVRGN
jgi:hypothetical protein